MKALKASNDATDNVVELEAEVAELDAKVDGLEGTVSEIVVGTDGAEYERTTYPDGAVRYKTVFTDLP